MDRVTLLMIVAGGRSIIDPSLTPLLMLVCVLVPVSQ